MAPKPLIIITVALLMLAPARSGNAVAPPWEEAHGAGATPLGLNVAQLKGATLHGENGDALGEIEQVLATPDGLVVGLAVNVGGGFLGMGGRQVILRFDQVHRDGNRVATRLSRAQLDAQPPWDD